MELIIKLTWCSDVNIFVASTRQRIYQSWIRNLGFHITLNAIYKSCKLNQNADVQAIRQKRYLPQEQVKTIINKLSRWSLKIQSKFPSYVLR